MSTTPDCVIMQVAVPRAVVEHLAEAYRFAQFDKQNMAALATPTFNALHTLLSVLDDANENGAD
jgi:hypothetical protein